MHAELLIVEGCPHAREAERRFRVALDLTGHHDVRVVVKVLDTAAPEGCFASPAFRINDVDLLGDTTDGGGPSCLWTIPTTSDLAEAITPRGGGRRFADLP